MKRRKTTVFERVRQQKKKKGSLGEETKGEDQSPFYIFGSITKSQAIACAQSPSLPHRRKTIEKAFLAFVVLMHDPYV
jgi:hypothetical protein